MIFNVFIYATQIKASNGRISVLHKGSIIPHCQAKKSLPMETLPLPHCFVAACIESLGSSMHGLHILNNVNESMCMRIHGESSDNQTVIRNLQVNKTCARESDVSNT